MTTGRINQVTVLHTRPPRAPRQAAGTGALTPPFPGQSKSPTDQVAPHRRTARTSPSRVLRHTDPQLRVPSPPTSHASGAPPQVQRTQVDPFGEDYRQTAAPPTGGLPERGGSSSGWLQAELAIGYQSTSLSHHPQQHDGACCRFAFQTLTASKEPDLEPGRNPSPSGYILPGRHINRSDPGRPAVPPTSRALGILQGRVDTSRLAVPAPFQNPKSTRRAHSVSWAAPALPQGGSQRATAATAWAGRSRGTVPSHAEAESRDHPVSPPTAPKSHTHHRKHTPPRRRHTPKPPQPLGGPHTLMRLPLHVVGKGPF